MSDAPDHIWATTWTPENDWDRDEGGEWSGKPFCGDVVQQKYARADLVSKSKTLEDFALEIIDVADSFEDGDGYFVADQVRIRCHRILSASETPETE